MKQRSSAHIAFIAGNLAQSAGTNQSAWALHCRPAACNAFRNDRGTRMYADQYYGDLMSTV